VIGEQKDADTNRGTQTAGRALDLLEHVVRSRVPLRSPDLQGLTGLNRSAIYRLLHELCDHDFIARDERTNCYVVGPKMIALATLVLGQIDIRNIAHPALARISEYTSETVSLHLRQKYQRVCIDVVESPLPVKRVVPVGETLPLYAGPTGKTLLAFLTEDERLIVLDQAARAGVALDQLKRQLQEIRTMRHMSAIGDRVPEVGALSVPVFDSTGPVATVTVSGPSSRFTRRRMKQVAPWVIAQVDGITAALGGALQPMDSTADPLPRLAPTVTI
jgi:DNA-binding IclR family transcriptional regulator